MFIQQECNLIKLTSVRIPLLYFISILKYSNMFCFVFIFVFLFVCFLQFNMDITFLFFFFFFFFFSFILTEIYYMDVYS